MKRNLTQNSVFSSGDSITNIVSLLSEWWQRLHKRVTSVFNLGVDFLKDLSLKVLFNKIQESI